jgi:hypothetical protein
VARPGPAEPDAFPIRLDAAAALRVTAAFAAGLVIWFAFAAPYERTLATAAELAISAFERPAATTLVASGGEIRVERSDFPPDSPRPGLPAADLHFNFALLAALFALPPHPLRLQNFARFWAAAALLWAVHVAALVFEVESVYATRLGPWSAEHYGAVARNVWAAGFHFYLILGRFAAPFVLWWMLGRPAPEAAVVGAARGKKRPKRPA